MNSEIPGPTLEDISPEDQKIDTSTAPKPSSVEEMKNPFKDKEQKTPLYKGNTNKMEVFNEGENGHDRSVRFHLKMGVQEDSFALSIDPKDEDRVINLPDSRAVNEMSTHDLQTVVLMQKDGGRLSVKKENLDKSTTQETLREKPFTIPLSKRVSVELLGFDPEENTITIRKVEIKPEERSSLPRPLTSTENPPFAQRPRTEPQPKTPGESSRSWRQKLVDIIGPIIIGAPTILAGEEGNNTEPPIPPPVVQQETEDIDQPGEAVVPIEEQHEQPAQEKEVDPSLRCEKTENYEIKEGDFLTKALVDVNGISRYLDENGKMNVNKLYQDLMCLLAIPENQDQLQQSDPLVAQYVSDMTSQSVQDLTGPINADRLYEGLQFLNSPNGEDRYPGAHKQLVVVQPGQHFLVPTYKE